MGATGRVFVASAALINAVPVILTGTDVPRLIGVAPAKILAYRYYQNQWIQVPVQVGHNRFVVDCGFPQPVTAQPSQPSVGCSRGKVTMPT